MAQGEHGSGCTKAACSTTVGTALGPADAFGQIFVFLAAAVGYATATNSRATWAPAITGNIVVVGTDPGNHGHSGTGLVKTGASALNNAAVSYVAGEHRAGRMLRPNPLSNRISHAVRTTEMTSRSDAYPSCAGSSNGGTGWVLRILRPSIHLLAIGPESSAPWHPLSETTALHLPRMYPTVHVVLLQSQVDGQLVQVLLQCRDAHQVFVCVM